MKSTTAGSAPNSHCVLVRAAAPSNEVSAAPRAIRIASATSTTAVMFSARLSKVSTVRIDIFSSRDSKAATTSIREKATRPIVLAIWVLSYWCFPATINRSMASDMKTPTRPTVVRTAGVMMEAARGRG